MSLAEYIKPETIRLGLKSKTRHEVLKELASTLKDSSLLDEKGVEILVQKLEEREKLSTTGVGEGIALPHASLRGLRETVIGIGHVPDGVDFGSVDNKPVTLIFMIVGSQTVPRLHIQILARLVRLCRNKELMKKIQNGTTPTDVLEAIRLVDI